MPTPNPSPAKYKCPDGIGFATHRSNNGAGPLLAKEIAEHNGIIVMKWWNQRGRRVHRCELSSKARRKDGSIHGWSPINA